MIGLMRRLVAARFALALVSAAVLGAFAALFLYSASLEEPPFNRLDPIVFCLMAVVVEMAVALNLGVMAALSGQWSPVFFLMRDRRRSWAAALGFELAYALGCSAFILAALLATVRVLLSQSTAPSAGGLVLALAWMTALGGLLSALIASGGAVPGVRAGGAVPGARGARAWDAGLLSTGAKSKGVSIRSGRLADLAGFLGIPCACALLWIDLAGGAAAFTLLFGLGLWRGPLAQATLARTAAWRAVGATAIFAAALGVITWAAIGHVERAGLETNRRPKASAAEALDRLASAGTPAEWARAMSGVEPAFTADQAIEALRALERVCPESPSTSASHWLCAEREKEGPRETRESISRVALRFNPRWGAEEFARLWDSGLGLARRVALAESRAIAPVPAELRGRFESAAAGPGAEGVLAARTLWLKTPAREPIALVY